MLNAIMYLAYVWLHLHVPSKEVLALNINYYFDPCVLLIDF